MKNLLVLLGLCTSLVFANTASQAAEINGIAFEDSATVGDQPVVLNGLGIRYKFVKVYALGLYLTEKKHTTAEILALSGPKRFRLVTMRDISSEELAQAVLAGIQKNLSPEEQQQYANQLAKFGDLFKTVNGGQAGDVIIGDYIPGTGTVIRFNGKPLGQPLPELGFYNAILRIWIGSNPADPTLKPRLLGEKPDT